MPFQGYLRATLLENENGATLAQAPEQPLFTDSGYPGTPATLATSNENLNALPVDLSRSLERRISNRLSNQSVRISNHNLPGPEDPDNGPSGPDMPTGPNAYSRSGSRQEETHVWLDVLSLRKSHYISEKY